MILTPDERRVALRGAGPMENLLDGLDESSDALLADGLRQELAARGIDVDAEIAKVEEKIAKVRLRAAKKRLAYHTRTGHGASRTRLAAGEAISLAKADIGQLTHFIEKEAARKCEKPPIDRKLQN